MKEAGLLSLVMLIIFLIIALVIAGIIYSFFDFECVLNCIKWKPAT